MIQSDTQKGKLTKLGNGSPANMFQMECSSEGFASPSFEEFALIVDITFNINYRTPIDCSLGLYRKYSEYFLSRSDNTL
jgi:hypothetical protein